MIANLGPLTDAARLREAAERFRQSQSGLPGSLFVGGGASGAGRGTGAERKIKAADRHKLIGMQRLEEGKLSSAIVALRKATELDPLDAEVHYALGRALGLSERLSEAAASFREATALKADFALAYHDLGVVLDLQGLDTEAVAAFRRALQLDPGLPPNGHARLGELLEDLGDIEEAAESFRRANAAAPDTSFGRYNSIRALLVESEFGEAERQLRAAIALDPGSDRLVKVLADILSAQGRFEEALEACDRALSLNPLQVPAYLCAVHCRTCTETDRPRLAQMLSTLETAASTDEQRWFLHFAIGKFLADLGEYQEAMRHFDLGNGVKGKTTKFDQANMARHADRMIERFTPAFFAANTHLGLDDETPLLIVGMPRSGTTLVEQILSSHPQVAAGDELPYWNKKSAPPGIMRATYITPELASKLTGDYLSLLRRIGPGAARVTDKMPFNYQTLGLIHLLLPKARIIHCRRHPVDTCLSIYSTPFKERIPFVNRKADLVFAYRQYERYMDHWRRVLPSDRFMEVDYEYLVANREAEARRMIVFSGLDWNDACLQHETNERTVKTASTWQARQPVYTTSVERWRRYEPWLGELRELLPGAPED